MGFKQRILRILNKLENEANITNNGLMICRSVQTPPVAEQQKQHAAFRTLSCSIKRLCTVRKEEARALKRRSWINAEIKCEPVEMLENGLVFSYINRVQFMTE